MNGIPAKNNKDDLYQCVITNNVEISPGVHVISFVRDFNFTAGQVVKIGIDLDTPPRIYSICSGEKEDNVDVLFNIKEGGLLTPKLATLIPGEKIFASEPYGTFLGNNDPAWWIATGTGIAPFYSMLKSGFGKNKKLIHGVRHLNQFYFEDELEYKLGENFIRCCSKEQSCDVYYGRVTNYLSEITKFPDIKYYICGSAIMVVEVRDLLIEKGIPFENIFAEIYF